MINQQKGNDVIIVGGGVIGLLCAYRLAQAGHSVAIYERDEPGQEASKAALGVLNPKAAADVPAAYTALEWASLQLFPELAEELQEATGIHVGLNRAGVLHALFNEAAAGQADQVQALQTAAGIPAELLTAKEAREQAPDLDAGVLAAVRFGGAQNIDNVLLCTALVRACLAVGVQIHTGQPVLGIERTAEKVSGVRLHGETHACGAVVVAGGSWSGQVAGLRLPVEPVKGQALTVDSSIVLKSVLQCDHIYLVPRRDGGVMIGASVEQTGFDQRVTVDAIGALLEDATRCVPALGDAAIRHMWAGLRPRSADDMPVLGPVTGCAGLYVATGHFRNGILLAPITAQLITSWLDGQNSALDVTLFTPDRYNPIGHL